jgi:DNA adenine methylase
MRPHRTYVEAFAGGMAVLLAKKPSAAEIVNDLNGELVNLYRYAQFHCDALIAEVQWMVNSRENLLDLVNQPGLTGLQRAARYLMRNRMSFGGAGRNFAVAKQAQPSREGVLELLRGLNQRLDKVAVENLPYERLLPIYDSPETLWFLDAPYSAGETSLYGMWTEAEMRAFARLALGLQGDWIIIRERLPGEPRAIQSS